MSAPEPVAAPANAPETAKKTPKPKSTFMLHDPKTFESLGKYVSTDARYSALKAASRGVEDIYLRKTNTKIIFHYKGSVVTLDTPQVVLRGKREIIYSKKPVVKFQKKFVYEGDLNLDAQEEQKPEAMAE